MYNNIMSLLPFDSISGKNYSLEEDKNSQTKKLSVDSNGDGEFDSITTFYNDEKGNVLKGMYDIDADNINDSASIFEYDEKGRITTRYNDLDADEIYDNYYEFFYDENNNKTSSEPKELTACQKTAIRFKDASITRAYENIAE